jgi:tetratricopeptide (TPR) repeat protein
MTKALLVTFIFTILLFSVNAQPPSVEDMAVARDHFNLGVKNGIDENFEDAIIEFQKAIELNPLFAEAFLYKGLAELEMQNYDQAVKDLTITIELDPGFSDQAHYFRGLARYNQDNLESAVDDFTIAIRMNPDFVSFYQRGKANLKLKEYRRSLQDFDIALRLNEEFYEAHLYRGINLYYLDRYEAALTDLDIASKNLPGNADVQYYLNLVGQAMRNGRPAEPQTPVARVARPVNNTPHQQRNPTAVSNPQPASSTQNSTPSATPVLSGSETQQPSRPLPASTDINFAELFSAAKPAPQTEPAKVVSIPGAQQHTQEVQQNPTQNATPNIPGGAHSVSVATQPSVIPANPGSPVIMENLETGIYSKDLQKQPMSGFGVQVASYSATNNLQSLSQAYAEKYSKPVFINISQVNGRKLYKLIIGQFSDRTDAESFRDFLRTDNFPDSFLVVFQNM